MKMINPPMESAALGRRAYQRLRLGMPAELILTSGRYHCQLDDLSTRGAKVTVQAPPRALASAFLRWPGGEAFGLIVWSVGSRCGLQFDEALTPDAVFAARRAQENKKRQQDDECRTFAKNWTNGKA